MEIRRKNLDVALAQFAKQESGVVVGAPGVGKTFALKKLAKERSKEGLPVLYLPVDKLGARSDPELSAALGIETSVLEYLAAISGPTVAEPGVLIIDALDAARSDEARQFFLFLARSVIGELGDRWRVILSVREYDARKSPEIEQVFPSVSEHPPSPALQSAHIGCRHLYIPRLNPEEASLTSKSVPGLGDIYQRGSDEFKELLRTPFNVWLLERLLASGAPRNRLNPIRSEVQLLSLFWHYRVASGPLASDKILLARRAAQAMVDRRSLNASFEDVYTSDLKEAWAELLSSEVLTTEGRGEQLVLFSHNILFDYAVSALLIGDAPADILGFLEADPARTIFLRPSLHYSLAQDWHERRDVFWDVIWSLHASTQAHVRLLERVLPPSVVATEAHRLDDLAPVLDRLESGDTIAAEILALILQSIQILDIRNDSLWSKVLLRAAEQPMAQFAWEGARLADTILNRIDPSRHHQVRSRIGTIARALSRWAWNLGASQQSASTWAQRLGARIVLPLVVQTYSTDATASETEIRRVLQTLTGPDPYVDHLYALTDSVDSLWSDDPELVAEIYRTTFTPIEVDEEPTTMSGPVLGLISNRRQDFDMARYNLVRQFEQFLQSAPREAAGAGVDVLNSLALEQRGRSNRQGSRFGFRDGRARYIPDMSYIWDSNGHDRHANDLIAALMNSLEAPVTRELVLDAYRDRARAAFLWRRLLRTAASEPSMLARPVVEVASAKPVMSGEDTFYEVGLYLESASSYLHPEKLADIEKRILRLPHGADDEASRERLQRRRDTLLGRIPSNLLQTPQARKRLRAMESGGGPPPHQPLFQIRAGWRDTEDRETEELLERGISSDDPEVRVLLELKQPLDEFLDRWRNDTPDADAIQGVIPHVIDLHTKLAGASYESGSPVLDLAWTPLATVTEYCSRAVSDLETETLLFLQQVALEACQVSSWPLSAEGEDEPEFDHPGWSVRPETEGTQALMRLAAWSPQPASLEAIEAISRSSAPELRFLVVHELPRLFTNVSESFWKIAIERAEHEPNRTVQAAVAIALGAVASRETSDEVSRVLALLTQRVPIADWPDALVSIAVGFHIVLESQWGETAIGELLEQPMSAHRGVKQLVASAVEHLTSAHDVGPRARDLVIRAIESAGIALASLRADTADRAVVTDLYGALDEPVTRIYFSMKKGPGDDNEDSGPLELDFFLPILTAILDAVERSENFGLMARTAHHFMELLNLCLADNPEAALSLSARVIQASAGSGYAFDSLAVREATNLVETVLADHRGSVQTGDGLSDLLVVLNAFVESGWPQAQDLVWKLEEVFR